MLGLIMAGGGGGEQERCTGQSIITGDYLLERQLTMM